MIIDSHQHFWKFDPVRDSWIDDTMQVLRRDFLPSDLNPLLKKNTVYGTIAVQADQSEKETYFLLELAEKNDWIKAVIGWVDLMADDIEERLNYFSQFKKLKGFRHIVQDEPDDNFMFNDKFQRGISFLKDFGFSFDILIYPRQLSTANRLVQNYPQQIFVLDHIAKPHIKDQKKEPWASDIKELARNKNVYCKVSGIITEADHIKWKREHIFPYLDIVFDSFGINRLMFGSDWPVCLLAGSYTQVVDLLREYTKTFSGDDKAKLFGGNALAGYGIH